MGMGIYGGIVVKYEVTVSEKIFFTYQIEAESEDEARIKALDEYMSSEPNDWSDSDGGFVESVTPSPLG